MTTIFVAEIVCSKLGTDGKWHIDSNIIAYNNKEYAIQYIDEQIAFMKTLETVRPKFGRVYELETDICTVISEERQEAVA